jgi:hypothetical protein
MIAPATTCSTWRRLISCRRRKSRPLSGCDRARTCPLPAPEVTDLDSAPGRSSHDRLAPRGQEETTSSLGHKQAGFKFRMDPLRGIVESSAHWPAHPARRNPTEGVRADWAGGDRLASVSPCTRRLPRELARSRRNHGHSSFRVRARVPDPGRSHQRYAHDAHRAPEGVILIEGRLARSRGRAVRSAPIRRGGEPPLRLPGRRSRSLGLRPDCGIGAGWTIHQPRTAEAPQANGGRGTVTAPDRDALERPRGESRARRRGSIRSSLYECAKGCWIPASMAVDG